MHLRLIQMWEAVRNSYWFVPTLMAAGAALLFFVALQVDLRSGESLIDDLGWIFSGSPDGARDLLSTVAGSMITVAGVTFSITIVALSLASGQFGPRLLSSFMRDKGNQVVLGTFVSTYIYCLLVLRTIRGAADEGEAFVPYVSVTVGVGLALVSLGVLIYFIHHVSVSIQAPQVVAAVARDLHGVIDRLYPTEVGHGAREEPPHHVRAELPENFEEDSAVVEADRNGYLEAVDLDRLMKLACDRDAVFRLEHRPGQFVTRGEPLLRLHPREALSEEDMENVCKAFALGPQRTPVQDIEFPVAQLVEVALRALSPSINDPFTAINCIDHLGAALCHLLRREVPSSYRFDESHRLRLVAKHAVDFRGVVDTAFSQIRQNAGHHVSVRVRLLEAITGVMLCARSDEERAALLRQADLLRDDTVEEVPNAADRADIEERYRALLRAVGGSGSHLPVA